MKAFKDQGKGKKSKKEEEEKPKKVFNPLAEQRRKEKEQDAMPVREGPKVKKADCRADGDLKALNKSSVQQSNKSEVRNAILVLLCMSISSVFRSSRSCSHHMKVLKIYPKATG